MIGTEIELQTYKKAVSLVDGQKLSGVHEIYYSLAKNIKKLVSSQNSKTIHQYFDAIIQKILLGEAVSSNELPKITSMQGLNSFDLNTFEKTINKAKAFIDQANETHKKYCADLLIGFKDILTTYQDFSDPKVGTGFFGVFNRFKNNYSYNGRYTDKKYQPFIHLIDHLALLDASGVLIKKLLDSLNQMQTFDYQNQADFLDEIYLIFSQLQEHYFLNLQLRDEQIIQKLIEQYQIKPEHHEYFKKYYTYKVHNIGKPEVFLPHICLSHDKLRFDVEQVRDDTEDSHNHFKNNSEQLKDKIHQVAEDLGLHFRIKNQTENKENDKRISQIKNHYKKLYYLEQDLARCNYLISRKEQEDRAIKKRDEALGKYFSILIAMGEACVSCASIMTVYLVCPPLAIGLMVWFSAAFINRLLFKSDIQDGLDDLFLKVEVAGKLYRRIFCDENGEPLSAEKKLAILIAGVCSVATGIVCGALSFMSSSAIWPSVLGFLSMHGTGLAVLGIALSAGPASLMAVGITYLFGKVIADFIRKDRHKKIAKYVDDFFIKPWKAMGAGDGIEKAKHLGKCLGRICLLTLAVGITVVATVASMGVFYQQTLSFLSAIATSNPKQWMKKIAQTATWVNALISMPFQIDNTNKVFQGEIKRFTFTKLSEENIEKMPLSSVQKDAVTARTIGKVLVATTTIINGLGVGELDKIHSSSSLNSVHLNKLTGSVSSTVLSNTTLAAAAMYSIAPNEQAGCMAYEQGRVDPLVGEISCSSKEKLQQNVFHSPRLWSPHKSDQLEKTLSFKRCLKGG